MVLRGNRDQISAAKTSIEDLCNEEREFLGLNKGQSIDLCGIFRLTEQAAEVNILPFVRMKHPGTITWLWGRITVGANCVIFAKF